MADETERITRVENRVDTLTEQTSELRGAYEHLATKSDVDKATLKIVLWIVGVGLPAWRRLTAVGCG